MNTEQECWDACLIKGWRDALSIRQTGVLYHSITGKWPSECTLLRSPYNCYLPPHTGLRVFVAQRLPKISDWLFDKPRERDVELYRNLSKSKYDVLDKPYTTYADAEHNSKIRALKVDKLRVAMSGLAYGNRNNDTNWNVTKGPSKIRRAK